MMYLAVTLEHLFDEKQRFIKFDVSDKIKFVWNKSWVYSKNNISLISLEEM